MTYSILTGGSLRPYSYANLKDDLEGDRGPEKMMALRLDESGHRIIEHMVYHELATSVT